MGTYITIQQSDQIKIWKTQLIQLKHDQICDIHAPFLTRLNRYIRIKCLRYLLNQFTPLHQKPKISISEASDQRTESSMLDVAIASTTNKPAPVSGPGLKTQSVNTLT